MTEQEKIEKAIGALSKIVCDGCGACCGCFSKRGWENLYYYILHKEEEVQKETATKFYNELKNEVETEYDKRILNIVAKEFGVEVEE